KVLSAAVAAAPESYYGLRAQEQLGTTLSVARSTPPVSSAWLSLTSTELQERDAWLASLNTTARRVDADLAALAGLRRADALLEVGLRTEAGWEVDAVLQQYASAKDIAHMNWLADWLTARDLP